MQSDHHSNATGKPRMERRKPSWWENMSDIETIVSNDIYNHFEKLYKYPHNQDDKDGIHMKSWLEKTLDGGDGVRDHRDLRTR